MDARIIGREDEIQILHKLLHSKEPELLALYGRRRVGKTFLIRTYYKDHLMFSCSGQYAATTNMQLLNFSKQLKEFFPKMLSLPPVTWQEAFQLLGDCLNQTTEVKKKVIFFDEISWLDNHKSGFLSAFSYFWNMYASNRNDLLVIICGSAASWIIEKIINNKGGLHNRITQRIRLLPFSLKETEYYLKERRISIDRYQLLQLYMVMGGIPHYLKSIERGKSAAQNIDKICFSKDGVLANEFDNLYAALFNSADRHIQAIKALAKKNKGLTRNELVKTGKMATGGTLTIVLKELLESGFIAKTYPFGKKAKNTVYRLADEFSLFYFKFMSNTPDEGKTDWLAIMKSQSYLTWGGYAFENICFKHIHEIKKSLQIGGIHTSETSWVKTGDKNERGAQIDLLLDRADHCINVCEMKFSTEQFAISKKYSEELNNKLLVFRTETKTRKSLLLTFVTTYGLEENDYSIQLAEQQVTMKAFFE